MARKILFIVHGDPRKSPRPAEAIRIAAGVGTWRKVEVTVALCDAAVLSLSEFPDDLMDEDNFIRYLPILGELGRPIYVHVAGDAALLQEIGQSPVRYETIDLPRLASMASASDCVLRF